MHADAIVDVLKRGARTPGSVSAPEMLRAVVAIEKAKTPLPDNWWGTLSAADKRWRLVYTADSKTVLALNKGQPSGSGLYFPLTGCQKFDAAEETFENGVFGGPVGHLTFKGPCTTKGARQLIFDVDTMYLGLGPWRVGVPIKKDSKPLSQVDPADVKKLPFFIYAYIDDEIIVGRGRSGGLALWAAADPKWAASAGVLQVFK